MTCDVVWEQSMGPAFGGQLSEISVSGELGGGEEAVEVLICGY